MKATAAAIDIYHKVRTGLAKTYGVTPEAFTEGVPVEPRIQQVLEDKIMSSNAFLGEITSEMVTELTAEKIGISNGHSIAKRTNTDAGHNRRGVNPMTKDKNFYYCDESEYDAVVSWKDLDRWAHDPAYYTRWQNLVTHQTGEDRLKVGWWGQFNAVESENAGYATTKQYDMLQDFHEGWMQYVIRLAPSKVWGMNPDGSVKPIQVGQGGDFTNMDELVADLRGSMIPRKHRNRADFRVIVGDRLIRAEYLRIYHSNEDEAIQKEAIERYIASLTFGRTQIAESDQFPEHGLFLSPLKNISHYVQRGSMRRSIEANKHSKGVEDFNFMREDFLIEDLDLVGMIHPDAIQFKNRKGEWVSISEAEKWAVEIPSDAPAGSEAPEAP